MFYGGIAKERLSAFSALLVRSAPMYAAAYETLIDSLRAGFFSWCRPQSSAPTQSFDRRGKVLSSLPSRTDDLNFFCNRVCGPWRLSGDAVRASVFLWLTSNPGFAATRLCSIKLYGICLRQVKLDEVA